MALTITQANITPQSTTVGGTVKVQLGIKEVTPAALMYRLAFTLGKDKIKKVGK